MKRVRGECVKDSLAPPFPLAQLVPRWLVTPYAHSEAKRSGVHGEGSELATCHYALSAPLPHEAKRYEGKGGGGGATSLGSFFSFTRRSRLLPTLHSLTSFTHYASLHVERAAGGPTARESLLPLTPFHSDSRATGYEESDGREGSEWAGGVTDPRAAILFSRCRFVHSEWHTARGPVTE